jgi:hypothetical protein
VVVTTCLAWTRHDPITRHLPIIAEQGQRGDVQTKGRKKMHEFKIDGRQMRVLDWTVFYFGLKATGWIGNGSLKVLTAWNTFARKQCRASTSMQLFQGS